MDAVVAAVIRTCLKRDEKSELAIEADDTMLVLMPTMMTMVIIVIDDKKEFPR